MCSRCYSYLLSGIAVALTLCNIKKCAQKNVQKNVHKALPPKLMYNWHLTLFDTIATVYSCTLM